MNLDYASDTDDAPSVPAPVVFGKRVLATYPRAKRHKKRPKGDPADLDYAGPWAKSDSSDAESDSVCVLDKEETPATELAPQVLVETTERYVDRPFMEPLVLEPLRTELLEHAVPQKVRFTLSGHSKGVTLLQLFPNSGHLLLSGANDHNIFLWDLATQEKLRGYFAHRQGVRDLAFNAAGDRFLSCGYDNKVILWDTETGAIVKLLDVDATPNTVIFNPANEDEIVVGLANKKIEHYDLSGVEYRLPVQVYDHHLGGINSLLVVDSGRMFMSTSDDRTVRFWKWQVNIPAKIIADPTQHSMPCAVLHPTENFIALQTMDNTIQVIQGSGKFRFSKKKFLGHRVAGYGIHLDVSADGKLLASGDVGGNVFFWLWKSGHLLSKLKACSGYVTCVKWHPQRPTGIVAAGRSGEIVYCE